MSAIYRIQVHACESEKTVSPKVSADHSHQATNSHSSTHPGPPPSTHISATTYPSRPAAGNATKSNKLGRPYEFTTVYQYRLASPPSMSYYQLQLQKGGRQLQVKMNTRPTHTNTHQPTYQLQPTHPGLPPKPAHYATLDYQGRVPGTGQYVHPPKIKTNAPINHNLPNPARRRAYAPTQTLTTKGGRVSGTGGPRDKRGTSVPDRPPRLLGYKAWHEPPMISGGPD